MIQSLPMKIAGIGRYLPERIVTNAEVEQMIGLEPGMIEKTAAGVRERRWLDWPTSASWMGAQAALEAVGDAGLTLDDIDLILNASGTSEQHIPDGGPLIQRHLGLGESGVACMSVHTTCLSFLTGLNVAANFINGGQYRNILVISSDITSRAINPKEPEAFILFGDCAAAAVVTRPAEGEGSQMTHYIMRTFGEGAYLTCVMGGGTGQHPNRPDTKPEHNLFHMEGWKVYKIARKHGLETIEMMRPNLLEWIDEIRWIVPHQASMLAIKTLERFGIPTERIGMTIDRLGNCVAASMPATLYEIIRQGKLARGEKVLFIGTGAGLSIAAAIIDY